MSNQHFNEAAERESCMSWLKKEHNRPLVFSTTDAAIAAWLAAKKEAAEQQGLDLVDLERKLDRALEGENTKDLLDWLNTKRLAPTPYNEEENKHKFCPYCGR